MLAKNKNFRENYCDESEMEDEFAKERSFESLGFEVRSFPNNFASVNYPTFIFCIDKFIQKFKFCDTVIVIGKEKFHCHFIVIKCFSKHFEKFEKNTMSIELPTDQVTPKAFCEIYEWMLATENHIKRESFAEVFKAVRFLQIDKLLQHLMMIIDDQHIISEREAISIFLEAKRVNAKCLQSFMIAKVSKIFLTFVASKEFVECTLDEALEFFKSNRIAINSEVDMIFTAIRWLLYKWPRRKNNIKQILKQIKFELIVPWQLVEFKKYPQQLGPIFHPIEIQTAIDEALSYQSTRHIQTFEEHSTERLIVSRRIIDDPIWKEFDFESNSNVHVGYNNFKQYLKRLNTFHWTRLECRDNNKILNT